MGFLGHPHLSSSRTLIIAIFLLLNLGLFALGINRGWDDIPMFFVLMGVTLVFGYVFWGRQIRRVKTGSGMHTREVVTSHPDRANIETFLACGLSALALLWIYRFLFPEDALLWERLGGLHAIPFWGNLGIFYAKGAMALHSLREPKRLNPNYLEALEDVTAELHADSYPACSGNTLEVLTAPEGFHTNHR